MKIFFLLIFFLLFSLTHCHIKKPYKKFERACTEDTNCGADQTTENHAFQNQGLYQSTADTSPDDSPIDLNTDHWSTLVPTVSSGFTESQEQSRENFALELVLRNPFYFVGDSIVYLKKDLHEGIDFLEKNLNNQNITDSDMCRIQYITHHLHEGDETWSHWKQRLKDCPEVYEGAGLLISKEKELYLNEYYVGLHIDLKHDQWHIHQTAKVYEFISLFNTYVLGFFNPQQKPAQWDVVLKSANVWTQTVANTPIRIGRFISLGTDTTAPFHFHGHKTSNGNNRVSFSGAIHEVILKTENPLTAHALDDNGFEGKEKSGFKITYDFHDLALETPLNMTLPDLGFDTNSVVSGSYSVTIDDREFLIQGTDARCLLKVHRVLDSILSEDFQEHNLCGK